MSTLTISFSSDLTEFNQVTNTSRSKGVNCLDSKAVGAHRPLSRRKSNPSADLLNSSESLTLLNNSLNQHSHLLAHLGQSEAKRGHRKLDRSQSEPVERANSANAANSSNSSSRYKTELCRPFEENGTCKYGDKCQFAHGVNELRSLVRHPKYKTEFCRTFHSIGFCPYGPRCHFIHNADEARRNATGVKTNPKFSLAIGVGGSTADSPSPPSSLSQSPTTSLNSCFFADDLLANNPFSPNYSANNAFLFGSDLMAPLFGRTSASAHVDAGAPLLMDDPLRLLPINLTESSPSPVESLASDLDSLSLSSNSPPPPPTECGALIGANSIHSSRLLRLPIFSRISETTNED